MPIAIDSPTFDIEHASKATGLSPGVIRMWELRYGWPRPARRPNGYRSFSAYQIEELKRMAALVKGGQLIGQLIENGVPKWPHQGPEVKPFRLVHVHELPPPASRAARAMRELVAEGLQRNHPGRIREQIIRCGWDLRLEERLPAVWLPLAVGLWEYDRQERALADRAGIEDAALDQIRSDLARLPAHSDPLWAVPAGPGHRVAAGAAALSLSLQGTPTRPWLWDRAPGGPFLLVGEPPQTDWAARAARTVAVAELARLRP